MLIITLFVCFCQPVDFSIQGITCVTKIIINVTNFKISTSEYYYPVFKVVLLKGYLYNSKYLHL